MKEELLAERVINYLKENYWDVYQEVYVGSVADIVAVRNNLTWIIECKTSASLKVIEQAVHWIGYANYVSVATPCGNRFFNNVLLKYGIGSIITDGHSTFVARIAPFNRKLITKNIKHFLCDEQKVYSKAGSAGNKRFTPFIKTKLSVYKFVSENNGCTLKQLIAGISHHYSNEQSAKANIVNWIDRGVIDGIDIIKDEKSIKLYMKGV